MGTEVYMRATVWGGAEAFGLMWLGVEGGFCVIPSFSARCIRICWAKLGARVYEYILGRGSRALLSSVENV